MKNAENIRAVFEQGFNCCQAVFTAFAPELGLDARTARRIASGFGGGMGRMGEVCGAVAGAFMVIGLKYGITNVDDERQGKRPTIWSRSFLPDSKNFTVRLSAAISSAAT